MNRTTTMPAIMLIASIILTAIHPMAVASQSYETASLYYLSPSDGIYDIEGLATINVSGCNGESVAYGFILEDGNYAWALEEGV